MEMFKLSSCDFSIFWINMVIDMWSYVCRGYKPFFFIKDGVLYWMWMASLILWWQLIHFHDNWASSICQTTTARCCWKMWFKSGGKTQRKGRKEHHNLFRSIPPDGSLETGGGNRARIKFSWRSEWMWCGLVPCSDENWRWMGAEVHRINWRMKWQLIISWAK